MPRCRVHDLVTEHRGELASELSSVSKPRFTAILPPAAPRVRHGAVQDDELVGQLPIADGGELLADTGDVRGELGIERVLAALHLLRWLVLLLADRDLLLRRDEGQLTIARHRIDDAAGERGSSEGRPKDDWLSFAHTIPLIYNVPTQIARRIPTEVPCFARLDRGSMNAGSQKQGRNVAANRVGPSCIVVASLLLLERAIHRAAIVRRHRRRVSTRGPRIFRASRPQRQPRVHGDPLQRVFSNLTFAQPSR